jgi:hypothetical protein
MKFNFSITNKILIIILLLLFVSKFLIKIKSKKSNIYKNIHKDKNKNINDLNLIQLKENMRKIRNTNIEKLKLKSKNQNNMNNNYKNKNKIEKKIYNKIKAKNPNANNNEKEMNINFIENKNKEIKLYSIIDKENNLVEENSFFNRIDVNIGNGPVYVSGWIKYFKYYPTMEYTKYPYEKIPRNFFKNEFFKEQLKDFPNYDSNEFSFDGKSNLPINIPGENYFYIKLMKNSLLIINSRKVKIIIKIKKKIIKN